MLRLEILDVSFSEVLLHVIPGGPDHNADLDISINVSADDAVSTPHFVSVTYTGRDSSSEGDSDEPVFRFVAHCMGTIRRDSHEVEAGTQLTKDELGTIVESAVAAAHPLIAQLGRLVSSMMPGSDFRLPVAAPHLAPMH